MFGTTRVLLNTTFQLRFLLKEVCEKVSLSLKRACVLLAVGNDLQQVFVMCEP